MKSLYRGGLLTCALLGMSGSLQAAAPDPAPAPSFAAASADPAYPALDAKQVGALRHLIALANQRDGDWTDMEEPPPGQGQFDEKQYQIPFMTYALAVTQTQQTPAYRELYKSAIDRNIHKMLRNDVWEQKWLNVLADPHFKKYLAASTDWRDPVRDKNIMYSGHLLQMIGLYEVLYYDRKWDKPGSIKFTLVSDPSFSRSYDFTGLAKAIVDQFVSSDFTGAECEPNLIFAACNQHPVLGLMSYDQVHGTKLADLRDPFFKKASELGMINRDRRMSWPYAVKEKTNVNLVMPANDGWTGVMMNGWKHDVITQIYPTQKQASVPVMLGHDAPASRAFWADPRASLNYGMFAAYAAEVGDSDTRQAMLAYADGNFAPVWRNGRYFYPMRLTGAAGASRAPLQGLAAATGGGSAPPAPDPEPSSERAVHPLAGNALLALARLDPGMGIWKTYNDLGATYVAGGPELVDVAYPTVVVRQAYYDRAKDTLAIGLIPGSDDRGRITFDIKNLNRRATYDVLVDGRPAARIARGRLEASNQDVALAWGKAGMLHVALTLGEGKSIVIRPGAAATIAAR